MLAMRQILLGPRGAAPVPLPYDYEVEYIQRDYGIAWNTTTDSNNGFSMLQYMPSGGPSTWDFSYECDMCGEVYGTVSAGNVGWAFLCTSGFLGFYGFKVDGPTETYVMQGGLGNNVTTGIPASLPSYHGMKVSWANGIGTYYADDVQVGTTTSTSTTFPTVCKILAQTSAATVTYPIRVRVSSFKLGNMIDLIPVVKGNQCGFYNKVDGELFLTDQSCISAGPRI